MKNIQVEIERAKIPVHQLECCIPIKYIKSSFSSKVNEPKNLNSVKMEETVEQNVLNCADFSIFISLLLYFG